MSSQALRTLIEDVCRDQRITDSHRLMLLYIAANGGSLTIGTPTFAAKLGRSISTIAQVRQRLRKLGYIETMRDDPAPTTYKLLAVKS